MRREIFYNEGASFSPPMIVHGRVECVDAPFYFDDSITQFAFAFGLDPQCFGLKDFLSTICAAPRVNKVTVITSYIL